jgi:RimJ/RimL family protein N-acetyltransferase
MVRLTPMTERDYQQFYDLAMPEYAKDQVAAGTWPEDQALELSRRAFARFLPLGLSTPDQFLYRIEREPDGEKVGYLWLARHEEVGSRLLFVYDFMIFETYRRQGYGQAALEAMEKAARELGEKKIQLHVFGHNTGARALYQKMGYVERNVTMVKELGQ